jgi:hypothetical protein
MPATLPVGRPPGNPKLRAHPLRRPGEPARSMIGEEEAKTKLQRYCSSRLGRPASDHISSTSKLIQGPTRLELGNDDKLKADRSHNSLSSKFGMIAMAFGKH